ncbi:hypothetical protein AcV5_009492 [Taiwanofungus camphoratus]|nr:hypothetical protein AcV5_009492 [Antrodia cinnamomea]
MGHAKLSYLVTLSCRLLTSRLLPVPQLKSTSHHHLVFACTMAAAPTKQALLDLYSNTLRASRAFSSYNFRQYFVRRTKSTFREVQDETDPAKLSAFYNDKTRELAVLKRSAIVNQLYGGSRLVVEKQDIERERSDN